MCPSQALEVHDPLLHLGVVAPRGVLHAPPADDDDGAVGLARAQLLHQLLPSLAAPAQNQRYEVARVPESGT